MLQLKCISTGSTANCYLLSTESETLIIDMGVKYSKLLEEIDDLDKIVGAILSHEHTDHNAINGERRTSDLLEQIGIKVLSPKNATVGKQYKLGSFDIIPVESKHNVVCYGYVIRVAGQIIYFATDTQKLTKFKGIQIDHFIVECNYCDYLCEEALLRDETNIIHLKSIFDNHHSLNSLENYCKDLKYKAKTIITIHKSNSGYFNSKDVLFVLKNYADNIYVANNHTTYKLGE